MNTMDCIAARKSVREFDKSPVEKEKLEQIVRAALYAPTGMHLYDSLHLTVLATHEAVDKFTDLARKQSGDAQADPAHGAGALIVVSGRRPDMPVEYANAACMIENMLLAATDLKLGSLYVHGAVNALRNSAQEEDFRKLLRLPAGFTPIGSVQTFKAPCRVHPHRQRSGGILRGKLRTAQRTQKQRNNGRLYFVNSSVQK